ncbi:hypothetical protein SUGI_0587110 [Cryptomeria japonica]|nr:hypothetical protein SUGI_0587110 [Cryptomeria japonica]
MATCSLGNHSLEKCIENADFGVGFGKDFVGLSGMDDMVSWDQIFAEETQFTSYKVLSEMPGPRSINQQISNIEEVVIDFLSECSTS